MEESESESEDEWASERAGDEQIPSEEEEEEDSEGVAQFEDDEDVGELSEEYDEEVSRFSSCVDAFRSFSYFGRLHSENVQLALALTLSDH